MSDVLSFMFFVNVKKKKKNRAMWLQIFMYFTTSKRRRVSWTLIETNWKAKGSKWNFVLINVEVSWRVLSGREIRACTWCIIIFQPMHLFISIQRFKFIIDYIHAYKCHFGSSYELDPKCLKFQSITNYFSFSVTVIEVIVLAILLTNHYEAHHEYFGLH